VGNGVMQLLGIFDSQGRADLVDGALTRLATALWRWRAKVLVLFLESVPPRKVFNVNLIYFSVITIKQ
jgi:hypothetical protein